MAMFSFVSLISQSQGPGILGFLTWGLVDLSLCLHTKTYLMPPQDPPRANTHAPTTRALTGVCPTHALQTGSLSSSKRKQLHHFWEIHSTALPDIWITILLHWSYVSAFQPFPNIRDYPFFSKTSSNPPSVILPFSQSCDLFYLITVTPCDSCNFLPLQLFQNLRNIPFQSNH